MTYEAFVLTNGSRQELINAFPPKYPEVVAHHVTYRYGVPQDPNAVYGEMYTGIKVVGYVDDGGIEAVVVSVNNNTQRPDGKVYHVTLSLDRSQGKKPQHSNDAIANQKVQPAKPMNLAATFEYI